MEDILLRITKHKAKTLKTSKIKKSLAEIRLEALEITKSKQNTDIFTKKILNEIEKNNIAIIAEAKKASPTQGIIRESFDIPNIVSQYEKGGASCISIITDEKFFQGKPEYIPIAKQNCNLPILRKDFIIDEYQIYESAILKADAILLIVSILNNEQLKIFDTIATTLGLSVMVEAHNAEELKRAQNYTNANLIGINNRNLRNFSVDLSITEELISLVEKSRTPVCESGITSKDDIIKLQKNGCKAFLIGSSLMKQTNLSDALTALKT